MSVLAAFSRALSLRNLPAALSLYHALPPATLLKLSPLHYTNLLALSLKARYRQLSLNNSTVFLLLRDLYVLNNCSLSAFHFSFLLSALYFDHQYDKVIQLFLKNYSSNDVPPTKSWLTLLLSAIAIHDKSPSSLSFSPLSLYFHIVSVQNGQVRPEFTRTIFIHLAKSNNYNAIREIWYNAKNQEHLETFFPRIELIKVIVANFDPVVSSEYLLLLQQNKFKLSRAAFMKLLLSFENIPKSQREHHFFAYISQHHPKLIIPENLLRRLLHNHAKSSANLSLIRLILAQLKKHNYGFDLKCVSYVMHVNLINGKIPSVEKITARLLDKVPYRLLPARILMTAFRAKLLAANFTDAFRLLNIIKDRKLDYLNYLYFYFQNLNLRNVAESVVFEKGSLLAGGGYFKRSPQNQIIKLENPHSRIEEFYNNLRKRKQYPSPKLYTLLILAMCKLNQPETALRYLKDFNVLTNAVGYGRMDSVNWKTCSYILHFLLGRSLVKEAVECFEIMLELNFAPGFRQTNALVNVLCKEGRISDAERVVERVLEIDPKFLEASCFSMLIHYSDGLPAVKSDTLDTNDDSTDNLNDDTESDFFLDSTTPLLKHSDTSQRTRAEHWFWTAKQHGHISRYVYGALFPKIYPNFTLLRQYYKLFTNDGFQPTIHDYNNLIHSALLNNHAKLVHKYIRSMILRGIKPDSVTYLRLLQHAPTKTIPAILQTMEREKIPKNVQHYTTIIGRVSFSQLGKIINEISNFHMDEKLCCAICARYAKAKQYKTVVKVLVEYFRLGGVLSESLVRVFLEACLVTERVEVPFAVFLYGQFGSVVAREKLKSEFAGFLPRFGDSSKSTQPHGVYTLLKIMKAVKSDSSMVMAVYNRILELKLLDGIPSEISNQVHEVYIRYGKVGDLLGTLKKFELLTRTTNFANGRIVSAVLYRLCGNLQSAERQDSTDEKIYRLQQLDNLNEIEANLRAVEKILEKYFSVLSVKQISQITLGLNHSGLTNLRILEFLKPVVSLLSQLQSRHENRIDIEFFHPIMDKYSKPADKKSMSQLLSLISTLPLKLNITSWTILADFFTRCGTPNQSILIWKLLYNSVWSLRTKSRKSWTRTGKSLKTVLQSIPHLSPETQTKVYEKITPPRVIPSALAALIIDAVGFTATSNKRVKKRVSENGRTTTQYFSRRIGKISRRKVFDNVYKELIRSGRYGLPEEFLNENHLCSCVEALCRMGEVRHAVKKFLEGVVGGKMSEWSGVLPGEKTLKGLERWILENMGDGVKEKEEYLGIVRGWIERFC